MNCKMLADTVCAYVFIDRPHNCAQILFRSHAGLCPNFGRSRSKLCPDFGHSRTILHPALFQTYLEHWIMRYDQ